jgi:hypothetical protein
VSGAAGGAGCGVISAGRVVGGGSAPPAIDHEENVIRKEIERVAEMPREHGRVLLRIPAS